MVQGLAGGMGSGGAKGEGGRGSPSHEDRSSWTPPPPVLPLLSRDFSSALVGRETLAPHAGHVTRPDGRWRRAVGGTTNSLALVWKLQAHLYSKVSLEQTCEANTCF